MFSYIIRNFTKTKKKIGQISHDTFIELLYDDDDDDKLSLAQKTYYIALNIVKYKIKINKYDEYSSVNVYRFNE